MKHKILFQLLAAVACFSLGACSSATTLRTSDGRVFRGRVVEGDARSVVIQSGRERQAVKRDEIAEVIHPGEKLQDVSLYLIAPAAALIGVGVWASTQEETKTVTETRGGCLPFVACGDPSRSTSREERYKPYATEGAIASVVGVGAAFAAATLFFKGSSLESASRSKFEQKQISLTPVVSVSSDAAFGGLKGAF